MNQSEKILKALRIAELAVQLVGEVRNGAVIKSSQPPISYSYSHEIDLGQGRTRTIHLNFSYNYETGKMELVGETYSDS